jgi:hypothetical protein
MVASIGNGTCPVNSVFFGDSAADVVLGVLVAGDPCARYWAPTRCTPP